MQYNSESRKYFPFNVQEVPTPNQTTENVVQYHQYSNVIDTQVAYAQDIRDLLLNRGRKVKEQTPQPHPGTEWMGTSDVILGAVYRWNVS